jgi:uncharacterized protein with HEPN domain
MKTTNKEIIATILSLTDKIEKTVERYGGYDEFIANDDFFDVIVLRVVLIGEEVNKLSNTFTEENPEIPWSGIVGTRNIIVHGYFDINADILWDTINNDIPTLKEFCTKMLAQ